MDCGLWTMDSEFVISRSERAWCFLNYISLFVRTYADLCRDRRRHARQHLNLNLYLYLYLYLYLMPYPAPNRTLFLNLFRKSFLRSNPALLDTL